MGWLELVTPTASTPNICLLFFPDITEHEYFITLEYLFPFLRQLVLEVLYFDLSSD